jgi:hypothetical protein
VLVRFEREAARDWAARVPALANALLHAAAALLDEVADEEDKGVGVGQLAARESLGVAIGLFANAAQRFGAAIEFEQQVQGCATATRVATSSAWRQRSCSRSSE